MAGEGGRRGVGGRARQLTLRGDRCFLTWVLLGSRPPWGLAGSRNGPSALLETATNHQNDSNNCGASFARRLTSPAHRWQPSTLTTIIGTAISPIPQVQHTLVQSPAQGHEPSKRGARLTLSPEPTQNQRPGPLPQFSPRLLLGRGGLCWASAPSRQWWRAGHPFAPSPPGPPQAPGPTCQPARRAKFRLGNQK